jgi:hypothetical protein
MLMSTGVSTPPLPELLLLFITLLPAAETIIPTVATAEAADTAKLAVVFISSADGTGSTLRARGSDPLLIAIGAAPPPTTIGFAPATEYASCDVEIRGTD